MECVIRLRENLAVPR